MKNKEISFLKVERRSMQGKRHPKLRQRGLDESESTRGSFKEE